VPQSRVIHLVAQASDIHAVRKRRPGYWFDSRRRYLLKHLGKLRTTLADAGWLAGYATWRVRRVIQRKPDLDPVGLLGDFAKNTVFARGFRL
jgi:hypothetical protein